MKYFNRFILLGKGQQGALAERGFFAESEAIFWSKGIAAGPTYIGPATWSPVCTPATEEAS
ncbi:hypothetical protein VU03_02610, partial [Desulfobulbus sp. N3]|nr:hypothetical protein [Desulfobulbus sp. N3]